MILLCFYIYTAIHNLYITRRALPFERERERERKRERERERDTHTHRQTDRVNSAERERE